MVNLGKYTIHGWYAGMGLGKKTFIIFLDELIRISPLLQRGEVHISLVVHGFFWVIYTETISCMGVPDLYYLDLF